MATEKMDYYQEVTNDIIKAIEEGTTPWQQGWDSKVGAAIAAVPMNGKTGRPYYKDNLLRLSIVMKKHGNSTDPRFFTFSSAWVSMLIKTLRAMNCRRMRSIGRIDTTVFSMPLTAALA